MWMEQRCQEEPRQIYFSSYSPGSYAATRTSFQWSAHSSNPSVNFCCLMHFKSNYNPCSLVVEWDSKLEPGILIISIKSCKIWRSLRYFPGTQLNNHPDHILYISMVGHNLWSVGEFFWQIFVISLWVQGVLEGIIKATVTWLPNKIQKPCDLILWYRVQEAMFAFTI